MRAMKPEDTDILVVEALNMGDLDSAISLYEPDATIEAGPGKFVSGIDAIRDFHSANMNQNAHTTINVQKIAQAGEIALLVSNWTVKGKDANGNDIDFVGRGTEVVRRQKDGAWKFVIDFPTGVE